MAWYTGTSTSANDVLDDLRGHLTSNSWTTQRWSPAQSGTYSQSGYTVTVSITAHGRTVGDVVNLDFTSGTTPDGYYTIATTATDSFTVTAAASTTTSGNVIVEPELIIKGPGSGSRSDFYVGIGKITGYDNLRLAGLTGYTASAVLTAQPGYSASYTKIVNLWNGSTPYWVSVDADRFVMVCQVSTRYMMFGAGFITVYGTDAHYGYPLWVFGSAYNQNNVSYSALSYTNHWKHSLLLPNGTWADPSVFHTPGGPYSVCPDGTYPIFPCQVYDTTNNYGEVSGLFGFTSVAGTNAGDLFEIGSDDYYAFPNWTEVSYGNFLLVKAA